VIGGGTTWKQVSHSGSRAAAVKTDGTLWVWGQDGSQQLGTDSANTSQTSPITTVGGGTTWAQVACGRNQIAAIKTDGTLWTWGYNGYGNLGNGSAVAGYFISPTQTSAGGTTWAQTASGSNHTLAVKTDGTLWAWGQNQNGQLGTNDTNNTPYPAPVAGGGTTWSSVACGYSNTAAIKTDGTLWTCGYGDYGTGGRGSTNPVSSFQTVAGGGTTWKQVACGRVSMGAVKTDGTLWMWGYDGYGNLGDNSTTSKTSPVSVVGGGNTWVQVACGSGPSHAFSLGVKTDGTLWAWGCGYAGNLGNGSTASNYSSPIQIASGISTWRSIACGYNPGGIGAAFAIAGNS
jgi:alpha-tubulin suppressor-like RCC1 family protein